MEGAATTVYAQGGRGNARLVAWEGERTVTFTMEDALISPEGFMILSGAGLIDAATDKPIYQHMTETVDMSGINVIKGVDDKNNAMEIHVSELPYMPKNGGDNFAFVMLMKNGEIISEPYIPVHYSWDKTTGKPSDDAFIATQGNKEDVTLTAEKPLFKDPEGGYWIYVAGAKNNIAGTEGEDPAHKNDYTIDDNAFKNDAAQFDSVIIDYYVARTSNARQIEITPDKFGGNYYLEASTLFRDQNGVDMPAEFIIPNCKIQSNFTFTMASSGDPSSFTFTMDAFPDYTKFDKSKKVLASIQIIEEAASQSLHRHSTVHEPEHDQKF